MLHKHNDLWSGLLGNINITQHHIDLIPGALPFKSALYRAGPKNRKLEQFEIDKQLKAGFIEHSVSELPRSCPFCPQERWMSPILC